MNDDSIKNSFTSESRIEQELKDVIEASERPLDSSELSELRSMRRQALSQKNRWFIEYRGLFSASLVTAAIFSVILFPQAEKVLFDQQPMLNSTDSMPLIVDNLMDDPEFYLWLDETGLLVTER